MNRRPPWGLIIQRASKQRLDKERRERELDEDMDKDPRRKDYRSVGVFDQAWIKPLIEDEE